MRDVRTVDFKPFYWHAEDDEEENTHNIYTAGLTPTNEKVMVKITDFTPYIYLELPSRKTWSQYMIKSLFDHFTKVFRNNAPISYKIKRKKNLYHLDQMNIMILAFSTYKALKIFSYKMRSSKFVVPNVGAISAGEFKAHESNIPSELKFITTRNIDPSGWITVKETITEEEEDLDEDERKFSINDIDFSCKWTDVMKCETDHSDVILKHSYVSFDIECYSENPNSKLPEPENPENAVFQISCRFGEVGSKDQRRVLLTLYEIDEIPNVEVISYLSEKDLLLGFTKLIQEENPDLLVGYNIMKFDWQYLIKRAELLRCYDQFMNMSRLVGVRAVKDVCKWKSAAYGTQEFEYIHSHGRMNVDLLPEIERNYKLPTYSLNAVSEHFLKEKKEDVTPKQLFLLFKITKDVNFFLEKGEMLPKILDYLTTTFPKTACGTNGEVKQLRKELLRATSIKQIKSLIKKPLWITGVYCDQDTNLPVRLMETLNLLTAMEAMSNCTNVPMSYLHTRGQQIKVVGQFLRNTLKENIVIPLSNKDDAVEKYQGATVIEANAGDYDNIVTLDFASLYPSMMISFNICYTTMVLDDSVPDDECYVLEWSEHKYCKCPKDEFPGKSAPDKKKIFCAEHRYRFYKPIVNPDGTRSREGLLPRMEREMLHQRGIKKKEMNYWDAVVNMNSGFATEKDINGYKKRGYEIIEKGSLSKEEHDRAAMKASVANAQQLALKVSANSMYGILGARKGYIPLIQGAASVTAMGRFMILSAIKYIVTKYPDIKLVYGDTDSCMLNFPKISLPEVFDLAERIGAETTHYLKCQILKLDEDVTLDVDGVSVSLVNVKKDMVDKLSDEDKILYHRYNSIFLDLEFENVYGRYLLLTKKRYVAYSVNRAGEVTKVTKKGVVLARRDNSAYLRETYSELIMSILNNKTEQEFMYMLYDAVHSLFTRQHSDKKFVIYMGVKNVVEYAEKKKVKMANGTEEEYFVSKIDGQLFSDPIGWDDDRLKYRNIPQCLLSLNMITRGTTIPANTRLEFLYIENDEAQYKGEQAEDYTYYKENRKELGLKVDYLHYLENQLSKPVTELLTVKYPKEEYVYEKVEDKFNRLVSEMKHRLNQHRVMKHRKVEKKINFIVESFRTYKDEPNEICGEDYEELYQTALSLKSKLILDKVYKKFGLKKRQEKRPTKRGAVTLVHDGSIMKDMLKYRKFYKAVVEELSEMFSPIKIN